MSRMAINFVLFQLGWFACVLGAAWQQPLLGSLIAVLILILHLTLSQSLTREALLIGFAILLGLAWDSWLVIQGWLSFNSGMWHSHLAPYWIILLWALFATTINHSLGWLRQRYLLASVLGAIAGPAAYYAGAELGAVKLVNLEAALLALAIGWALWMPLLGYVAQSVDRLLRNRLQKEFG